MEPKRISLSTSARILFPFIVLAIVACQARDSFEDGTSGEPIALSSSEQRQLIRDFTHLYVESRENLPFTARFLGLQIMQNPADMWVIQETISDVQPDLVNVQAMNPTPGQPKPSQNFLATTTPTSRSTPRENVICSHFVQAAFSSENDAIASRGLPGDRMPGFVSNIVRPGGDNETHTESQCRYR